METLRGQKAAKSRKGSVVGGTPWYIDQAGYLMKLENLVQTFLGLKEAIEDVFFRTQQCDTTVNDQPFKSTSLESFTRCERSVITCVSLFRRCADTLDIFRMACPLVVDELESSAKANFTMRDEVLFVKDTDFISVTVFPFKFLSLIATAIRRSGKLRRHAPHGCRAPAAPPTALQR